MLSSPGPRVSGLQNQVSAAAGTRRATSAFQLSGGCLSTRVRPFSQSPRARPQLALRALTWASPWSCSGVRASLDFPGSKGGRSGVSGRGIGGELDEGCVGQGDRSGYWEKSLYKGGGRGRSSELWRRTSELSGAGRELRPVPLAWRRVHGRSLAHSQHLPNSVFPSQVKSRAPLEWRALDPKVIPKSNYSLFLSP